MGALKISSDPGVLGYESGKAIIVFGRPHQMPTWAYAFDSENDLINSWADGHFKTKAHTEGPGASEPHDLETCLTALAHDMSDFADFRTPQEVLDYIAARPTTGGLCPLIESATRVGWLGEEEVNDEE